MSNKLKICLLISGRLGYDSLIHLFNQQEIICVFTDLQSREIIEFTKNNNIPSIIGNPRNKDPKTWQTISCDLLLSINYLFIIDRSLIRIARYAINIHGSLLPKYRGRTPHVWAIINGEKKTGITAHLIDVEVDAGDIILQKEIIIEDEDTGGLILEKFTQVYPLLINEILEKIIDKSIRCIPQDHNNATYFGKRTPDSGLINWNWFRERIRNWIRAQAHPYPGAFFLYEGNKVTVHKAIISDVGMNYETTDGTIIKVNNNNSIVIKTANGCIELTDLKSDKKLVFKTGYVLK